MKEQEFKIRKLKEKMASIAPTKKNKAEINSVKEQIEEHIQYITDIYKKIINNRDNISYNIYLDII